MCHLRLLAIALVIWTSVYMATGLMVSLSRARARLMSCIDRSSFPEAMTRSRK